MKTAKDHIESLLRRVRTLLGRELSPNEVAHVLATLLGWRDLIDQGMPPEQVVQLARLELTAHEVH